MDNLQIIAAAPALAVEHTSWYAVHTRSRHEKRVAAELERKGIKTFLPLFTEVRQWSDRRMKIESPLFSCYVFVNIPAVLDTRVSVLRSPGVLSFVGGNHHGITIPDRQIENVQTLLTKKVGFSSHPFLAIGQRVRVRGGALDGLEGVLERFNGSNRLVISVETIQRSLSVTVDGYDVEPVANASRTGPRFN
jgi:transcription antitermination factor NusG